MPDSSSQSRDFYRELGVESDASAADIQQAWREAAKRWHPDTNPSPDAEEMMKRINEARDVLSDPRRRAEYDRTYQQSQSGTGGTGDQGSRGRCDERRREREDRRARRSRQRRGNRASAEEEARRRREEDESRRQRERQERMQREAREQAQREREQQARDDAESRRQRERQEQMQREAREQAQREAREEGESRRQRERQERMQREAREQAQREREQQAREEEESRRQRERQERMQREAREQAQREQQARDDAESRRQRERQERMRREAREQARRESAGRERSQQQSRDRERRERDGDPRRDGASGSDSERMRDDAARARREHARQERQSGNGSGPGGVGILVWLAIGAALLIPIAAVVGMFVLNSMVDSDEPSRRSDLRVFTQPTATPAAAVAPTAIPPTALPAPTPTLVILNTATPPPTATPLPTLAPLPTATPSPLPTATALPTASPTPAPTATATAVPTATLVPTATAIPAPTATPAVFFDGSPTALHLFLTQVGVTADQVAAMIEAGASVEAVDAAGRDPLEVAAELGLGADILSMLIDYGADPSRSPTILHALLKTPDVRVRQLRVLVDAGASTVAEDARGTAPLEVAVAQGLSASVLRYLVFNGADVTHSPTILHALLASDAVTAEHVQVLLDAGASESGTNALGQTPLDVALANGRSEDILSLLR